MNLKGLHLEPTNICTLRCAGCARTRFLQQWPQHWSNQSLDIQTLMSFLDIDLTGSHVLLCGNYGDPIYHPDLPGMIAALKGRGSHVTIITNGSHRRHEWWQDLCTVMDQKDHVIFSIDGMPDDFSLYRENGDWSSIEQAIRICVQNGMITTWKFIPFAYNQHEIDAARDLSQKLGMSTFRLDPSDRFDAETLYLKPDQSLLGSRWDRQQTISFDRAAGSINPKCKDGQQHFITAWGYYTPCCYLTDHRYYHKTFWGKERALFDISSTRLSNLLASERVIDFYRSIPNRPPEVCRWNCPG